MFKPELFTATPRHRQVYGLYERIETAVDFAGAVLFILGSAFFFYPALTFSGTWMFLIGSVFFASRPTVRFAREFHLSRLPLPDHGHDVGS